MLWFSVSCYCRYRRIHLFNACTKFNCKNIVGNYKPVGTWRKISTTQKNEKTDIFKINEKIEKEDSTQIEI